MKSPTTTFMDLGRYLGPHASCVLPARHPLTSSLLFPLLSPNSGGASQPGTTPPKSRSKTIDSLFQAALGASPRSPRSERLSTSESGLKVASPLYSRCERTVPTSHLVAANLPRDTDSRTTPASTPASSLKLASPLYSRCERTVPTSRFVAVNLSRDIDSRSTAPSAAQRQPSSGSSGCGFAHKSLIYQGDTRTIFCVSAVGPLVITGRSLDGTQIPSAGAIASRLCSPPARPSALPLKKNQVSTGISAESAEPKSFKAGRNSTYARSQKKTLSGSVLSVLTVPENPEPSGVCPGEERRCSSSVLSAPTTTI
jgi:hypothetical protein